MDIALLGTESAVPSDAQGRHPALASTHPTESLARPLAPDLYDLARVTGTELLELMRNASEIRDRAKGKVVSYSRKVFLPLTNLCRNHCAYCAFSRPPSHPEAGFMSVESALAIARAGAAQGCHEALLCLGERPEERHEVARTWLAGRGHRSTAAYVAAMAQLVWRETGLFPHFNCGVLEEDELAEVASVNVSGGLMLESSSERLCERGGAHFGSPGKAPELRLAMIAAAGRQRVPFTTGILIGIGETPEERIDALLAIRELHDTYGHIQEIIVQNFLPHPGTPMGAHKPASLLDMLRSLALARIIFGGEMNVQAPPNLAPFVYQMYLLAGSNDWGGISPVTRDLINPDAPWPQIAELRSVSAEAGFNLRERLAVYPEFLQRTEFIRPQFSSGLERLVDESGYVAGAADA